MEFAKAAYSNVIDKENFYAVYDAFIYYSAVFRLHDFINSNTQIEENELTINEVDFPNYNYPSHKLYNGTRKCSQITSSTEFNVIANIINSISSENGRYYSAIEKIKNGCFSTEQLMKIASIIDSEDFKLQFAKKGSEAVYDIDNYIEMQQVFNTSRDRSDINERSDGRGSKGTSICSVSDEKYQEITRTIKNERFNTNMVNTAKDLIQTNKCFSALQIKGIVELFDYENARQEIAKYAYQFTKDKSKYYITVSDALNFESSKKKLLDYIKVE